MNFLRLINNLRTLILSNAEALFWSVFWPHAQTPTPGNVAIGLILFSYKVSLSVCVKFLSALIAVIPPLLSPAGAYHSAATVSLYDITPGITTDGGTHTFLPNWLSDICTCGQYIAA